MGKLAHLVRVHSFGVNVTIQVTLTVLMLASYALLVMLFLEPGMFHLRSLLNPAASGVKPTTASTLLGALLAAATSAFVTRCVEQSLWFKLLSPNVRRPVTVAESKELAGWSVSPFHRLAYVFTGDSWLLKLAGPCVVATAILSPILVSGISTVRGQTSSTTSQGPIAYPWSGYIDASNYQYNGGAFSDVPHVVSALAYLSGLAAPPSNVCADGSCSVRANVSAIKATCQSTWGEFTTPVRSLTSNVTYTSVYNPNITAVIRALRSPYFYANFTSWFPPNCATTAARCDGGNFAVIFGVFINNTDEVGATQYYNTVDCVLNFGTSTITQQGGNAPAMVSGSFIRNTSSIIPSGMSPVRRIYTDSYMQSPYYFTAATGTGDTFDSLYESALGTLLLKPKANSSAIDVSKRIEGIFDMATLMAFSRSPNSSVLLQRTTILSEQEYSYDPRVLLILLVPLVATIFGTWGRWRVSGHEIFIGYDPVEISRRGPIAGVVTAVDAYEGRDRDAFERKPVGFVHELESIDDGRRFHVG